MYQRRPNRTTPRSRSMALGGMVAALAVVGGGALVAVNAPADVSADDILLVQNGAQAAAQVMPLGTAVNLDLEPVVARAAGGTIPEGTTVQVTGLPDGLAQNGWVISGTPTRAGEYDVLVTVSNSGVSRSQKVAIAVTEEAGGATTPPVTSEPSATSGPATASDPSAETASPATADPSGATDPSTASEPSGATEPSTQVEPTLSAAPGDRSRAGAAGAADSGTGAGDGLGAGEGLESDDDDEVGVSPDLCAALEGGQTDASSLAQLLPMAGGDDAASTGLVMVLVNAVVGLLPSVLGEGGLLEDFGSAGELLCTLSPSLLGSQGDTPVGDLPVGDGADTELTGAADLLTGAQGGGAAAALPFAPALLGLLTTGAGSVGE